MLCSTSRDQRVAPPLSNNQSGRPAEQWRLELYSNVDFSSDHGLELTPTCARPTPNPPTFKSLPLARVARWLALLVVVCLHSESACSLLRAPV